MSVPDQFIAMALPAAQAVKAAYQVPPSVLIAQAALESGWGQHVKGNAYFGVKEVGSKGPGINFDTTEVINGQIVHINDAFRSYDSFYAAAMDYGAFLRSNERYKACFDYAGDPEKFVQTLAAAGYATAPNYALSVIAVMRSHNLTQYD